MDEDPDSLKQDGKEYDHMKRYSTVSITVLFCLLVGYIMVCIGALISAWK